MKNKHAVELGKRGGQQTLKKHGKDYYSRIGKMGGKPKKESAVDKNSDTVS